MPEIIPTTCTIGPDAVSGKRCGQPAVTTFTGGDGTVYAECAKHAVAGIPSDDTVQVHRHGRVYTGKVVKRTRQNVYAEVTYDNGVTRTVRV